MLIIFLYSTASYIWPVYTFLWSRDSSVIVVSDYGLDDRVIEVRSPKDAKEFIL
jgi:hypothetical protein